MRIRTLTRPLTMVVATLALLAVLPVSAQSAQTIMLRVADTSPPTHYYVTQGIKPWMDRVAALSKTKVEFQYFPSGQLGQLPDMLSILRSGVADIAYTPPSVLSGDFPLHTMWGLPGLCDNTAQGTAYLQLMHKEGPLRDEFTAHGVRPLLAWITPPCEILSVKKAVAKLEDVKGLKLRSNGGTMDMEVKALGGVPVLVMAADTSTSLQRGTIDGAVFPYASAVPYKLEEICKYATLGARLSMSVACYSISERVWQKLPADVREAMTKANEEVAPAFAKWQDNRTMEVGSSYEKQGLQISRLQGDELQRWLKGLEPVNEEWLKQMAAKGVDGQKALDSYKKAKASLDR